MTKMLKATGVQGLHELTEGLLYEYVMVQEGIFFDWPYVTVKAQAGLGTYFAYFHRFNDDIEFLDQELKKLRANANNT